LLDYAEGYALWRGARSVEIVVEPDNAAARRLYGRHGYMPVAAQLFERVLPAL
jgi:ribosomal protein S18 acetylase RimI-like enzyme